MRTLVFAKRNIKEIFRDLISLIFCIGLPLFLLIIFQQFNIPNDAYKISNFAPSVVVFSFTFITLFCGTLVSKDRTSSLLSRLFTSPLKPKEFVIGYTISTVPLAILQSILFLVVSLFFGIEFNLNLILTILISIPISILFVGLGILIGCIFSDKQTSGISSVLVQLVTFTSGMWFDINIMNNVFQIICNVLPFRYAVDLTRNILSGNYSDILIPSLILLGYIIVVYLLTIIVFNKKIQSDNK